MLAGGARTGGAPRGGGVQTTLKFNVNITFAGPVRHVNVNGAAAGGPAVALTPLTLKLIARHARN